MKQIGHDFQGWSINAMTLKEVLFELGFEEDDKILFLIKGEETNKLLNAYPCILEDDGMGYGTFPEFITEVDSCIYKNDELKENTFNIFRNENRNTESNILD